jgi:hypothetical protein
MAPLSHIETSSQVLQGNRAAAVGQGFAVYFNGFIEHIDVARTLEFAHKGVGQIVVHVCPSRKTPWHPIFSVFYLHNGSIDVGRISGDLEHVPTTATRLVQ